MQDEPSPPPADTKASPLAEGLREMLEASDKAGPMDQYPMMKPALDRFRRLAENVKPRL
jgi:hypothetical protein